MFNQTQDEVIKRMIAQEVKTTNEFIQKKDLRLMDFYRLRVEQTLPIIIKGKITYKSGEKLEPKSKIHWIKALLWMFKNKKYLRRRKVK